MLNIVIFLMFMLCSSCMQLSADIQNAPKKQANAVVFDIDSTLTPHPLEFWKARMDAAKAVKIYADKGYKIIYLSARITILQTNIPKWLKENGFPDGDVYVTETAEDKKDHARFKTRILQDYLAHGWKVEFAYGDSSTDLDTFAAAGIPKDRVFALRREGETFCQPGAWKTCLSGWTEHIDSITRESL